MDAQPGALCLGAGQSTWRVPRSSGYRDAQLRDLPGRDRRRKEAEHCLRPAICDGSWLIGERHLDDATNFGVWDWAVLAGYFIGIASFVLSQGVMLKGAGKVISVATGGQVISANGVVLVMTVAFLLCSFFGGLIASG